MAINPEPEEPMEMQSEVVEEVDEGSSEEVDSEESDSESDNESVNKSEVTHVATETRKDAVVVGDGGAKRRLITSGAKRRLMTSAANRFLLTSEVERCLFTGKSSMEKSMLRMGKMYFEAGEGVEGEKEWQKMKVMECKLNIRLLKVRAAQAKLIMDILKAEKH